MPHIFTRSLLATSALALALCAATPMARAADAPPADAATPPATPVQFGVVPLQNADFALPKVPDDEKWLTGKRADGWDFDVTKGAPGVAVEYWKKDRPPIFFWNTPNGSISQNVPAATFVVPREGTTFKLTYFYGGQGAGKFSQTSEMTVDGAPVATQTHDVEKPKGGAQTPATLVYVAKKEDVGKTVGVSFKWSCEAADGFVQAALKNVELSALPPAQ